MTKPITKTDWRALCARHASKEFGRIIPEAYLLAGLGKITRFTHWRYYSMAILHAYGFSLPRIASILGFKDHTTIINGLRRAHGHDGKKLKGEPLWTKEHFEKIVLIEEQENAGLTWRVA